METARRFYAIMAVCFGLTTLLSGWRVLAADGRSVWYVPLLLALMTAFMAMQAVRLGRMLRVKNENKED